MNELGWIFFGVLALSSLMAVWLPAPEDHRWTPPPTPPKNWRGGPL